MSVEIERKFLIKRDADGFLPEALTDEAFPSAVLTQGYLSLDKARQVRVRTIEHMNEPIEFARTAYLTIKGKGQGISRPEYEYEIPFEDAVQLFSLCVGSLIVKTRTLVGRWEIDAFRGDNEGLFVAEIELNSEDEQFERPDWLGEEVTDDSRYGNINLATNPFNTWSPR